MSPCWCSHAFKRITSEVHKTMCVERDPVSQWADTDASLLVRRKLIVGKCPVDDEISPAGLKVGQAHMRA